MRLRISLLAALVLCHAHAQEFRVLGGDAEPWARILRTVGFLEAGARPAELTVLRSGGELAAGELERVAGGAVLVLEGESATAEKLGFRATRERVRAASVEDVHQPKLRIVWEKPLELPVSQLPVGATVFAKERWAGTPLIAAVRHGAGMVLWVATSPGDRGYDRYPYLLHALSDCGVRPPFRSQRLWAFFDYSYRTRVDLEYMAAQWVDSGIAALHVAAWHFYERDPERDAYLRRLLAACHERGIVVYAWLELPHVSERFWESHPEWREKTALLQDAHLDWRKLMNLQNRECFRAVSAGVASLVKQFDWDGVNLAELYFESLQGVDNPARFTPMNDDVRTAYRRAAGADPLPLVRERAAGVKEFLEFRAELARSMQEEWLGEVERLRAEKPDLDVVLTHVDDRFDSGMRAAIGADAARVLPLLAKHSFTFLVEDPATVWHLGPDRYREIAARYAELTARREQLAIDLNIVERYQNTYPTKQQTGIELFDLVHTAAEAFDRVALYFENSIQLSDRQLLAAAGAHPERVERSGDRLVVQSRSGLGVRWKGGATVDGRPWPVSDGQFVWLPGGSHLIEPAPAEKFTVQRFTGDLRSAAVVDGAIEIAYQASSRALAVLSRRPVSMEIDGQRAVIETAGEATVVLPRGQHIVTFR